jgi:hypothetical protein
MEVLLKVEEGEPADDLPDGECDEFKVAEAIFADWDRTERLGDELQNAISGPGAFRYFKDTLRRYRCEKDWYAYRDETLRQIAIDWCKENGIEYSES